jgi:flagellar motility protein MotE (MotC chaperone)
MCSAILTWRSHVLIGCLAAAAILVSATFAAAESLPIPSTPTTPSTDAEKFCANIADAASDARFAWEAKTLKDLKAEVEAATVALEAKNVELQESLTRREEFQRLAERSVVDIYSRMRPEAAAAQLAALDERVAAAVLVKLNSRTASAILGEMDVPRAVSLAQLISSGGEAEESSVSQQ